jgi:hypothetical protein
MEILAAYDLTGSLRVTAELTDAPLQPQTPQDLLPRRPIQLEKQSRIQRTYYDRKRSEGKSHKQALIALDPTSH